MRITSICLLAAVALPSLANSSTISVRVDAFEVRGNVPPATIDEIRHGLATSLNADSCVNADVAPDPRDASYVVTAMISEESPIVALRFVDASTSAQLWADNYDWSNVPPATMAFDLLNALHTKVGLCSS
jgi:hypothetical protein